MELFHKEYDAESLYDLSRDVGEALDPTYNLKINKIPKDSNGFEYGTFIVTIDWVES